VYTPPTIAHVVVKKWYLRGDCFELVFLVFGFFFVFGF